MKKIYFGERYIALTSEAGGNATPFTNISNLKKLIDSFSADSNIASIVVSHGDEDELLKQFTSLFHPIDAAGGLIENANGQYLIIDRRGYIDLPKGKKEKGESDEENALREVGEETGISCVRITSHLTNTYHTYPLNDEVALKCTHWYRMKVDGCPMLTPQTEEDIASAQWVDSKQLAELSDKTYASLKEVFQAAIR